VGILNNCLFSIEWGEVVLHRLEGGGIDLENEIVTEIVGEDDHEREDEGTIEKNFFLLNLLRFKYKFI